MPIGKVAVWTEWNDLCKVLGLAIRSKQEILTVATDTQLPTMAVGQPLSALGGERL